MIWFSSFAFTGAAAGNEGPEPNQGASRRLLHEQLGHREAVAPTLVSRAINPIAAGDAREHHHRHAQSVLNPA